MWFENCKCIYCYIWFSKFKFSSMKSVYKPLSHLLIPLIFYISSIIFIFSRSLFITLSSHTEQCLTNYSIWACILSFSFFIYSFSETNCAFYPSSYPIRGLQNYESLSIIGYGCGLYYSKACSNYSWCLFRIISRSCDSLIYYLS
jgi:hypothetical protein